MKLHLGQTIKVAGKLRTVSDIIPIIEHICPDYREVEELYRFDDDWCELMPISATESELDKLAGDGILT